MNTQETKTQLQDMQVNVKAKIALLWVALMFLYIYNDILSFLQPGHVAQLVEGHMEGVEFTQTLMFGAAALMTLPSIMIILSLILKARANRLVNIIVGVFHLLVLLGTQFVGEGDVWFYWRLNEVLEAAILVFIIWTAWKWPTQME